MSVYHHIILLQNVMGTILWILADKCYGIGLYVNILYILCDAQIIIALLDGYDT